MFTLCVLATHPSPLYLQFECDLSELRGKVDTLSSGLDTATSVRKQLESEREQLRTQLDKATRTLQATTRRCGCALSYTNHFTVVSNVEVLTGIVH